MSNKQPIAEVKFGRVTAAIWANETAKGTYYNVTFTRLFKDGADWKRSDSFGRDDLLLLAKLADKAHSKIFELQAGSESESEEQTE